MNSEAAATKSRKIEHVNIVLTQDVQYKRITSMFEDVKLIPTGKYIDPEKVDLKTSFLGKEIFAPIFVSGMTGGDERVGKINYDIAAAVSELCLPMGVGSQRAMIEDGNVTKTYAVKSEYDVPILLGNIGAAQTLKYGIEQISEMVSSIEADALCIHTNPAQEAAQKEGDINFRGAFSSICKIIDGIGVKTIVKEVGNGISKEVARRFSKTNVYGLDTGGAGGTNWVAIELYRAGNSALYKHIFKEWGIPTAQSLIEVRSEFSRMLTATGGIRTASDIAKAIALGADACGIAAPVVQAQSRGGAEGIKNYLESMELSLREEMAALGVSNVKELSSVKREITGKLKVAIDQRINGVSFTKYLLS
ncbi:MAG: type 2 isopentenyl-diphosphate Delta-isomerase [Candidatus Micrarchaeaceae archaeon]